MAINPQGQVTTTGMMNNPNANLQAPDMSNLTPSTPAPSTQKVTKQPVPEENIENNIASLTDNEKIALDTVLSPSIVTILKKIAPNVGPLLDQFGSNEENVVLPVSVVKNYAIRRYGGANEAEAVQNFITDLSGEQSDNNNVPPGAAEGSQGMMTQQLPPETETSGINFDRIDQGLA